MLPRHTHATSASVKKCLGCYQRWGGGGGHWGEGTVKWGERWTKERRAPTPARTTHPSQSIPHAARVIAEHTAGGFIQPDLREEGKMTVLNGCVPPTCNGSQVTQQRLLRTGIGVLVSGATPIGGARIRFVPCTDDRAGGG
jgi:hypothetical protein